MPGRTALQEVLPDAVEELRGYLEYPLEQFLDSEAASDIVSDNFGEVTVHFSAVFLLIFGCTRLFWFMCPCTHFCAATILAKHTRRIGGSHEVPSLPVFRRWRRRRSTHTRAVH